MRPILFSSCDAWSVGSPSHGRQRIMWTTMIVRITIVRISSHCCNAWTSPERWIFIGRQRQSNNHNHGSRWRFNRGPKLRDRGPIAPQSGLIRHKIEATINVKLELLQCGIMGLILPTSSDGDRGSIDITIDARSWSDRGSDRSGIKAYSWPIPKSRRRPKKTPPRCHRSEPTTASNGSKSGGNSSLKARISLLCSSTFDRFVK